MTDTTQAEQPAQPQPGSNEYNQAMVDKASAARSEPAQESEAPPAEITPMPEGGADKFYNAETGEYNWQAHAKEAEYRLSQGTSTEQPKGEEQPNKADSEETPESGEPASISHEKLVSEFTEHGKLTDDTRAALTKAGVPDDTIAWMEANAAAASEHEQQVGIEHAGGQEAWDAMQHWAVANLPREAIAELNDRLAGPNWKNAIDDLKARYAAVNGTGPKPLINGGGGPASPSGYTSPEQMKADIADPRYQTDPAFRREVAVKMKNRNFAGALR